MQQQPFQILPYQLFNEYKNGVPETLLNAFRQLQESELSAGDFSFYTSVAAVYSSKIEGEQIELDSYVKYKRFGVEFLPDYTKKTDDLYNAYEFAKTNILSLENLMQAHTLLTQNLLPANRRGKIRKSNMYVTTSDGRIEYVAASPFALEAELNKFSLDLTLLLQQEMDIRETFFYAALLHLVFVKIHPFEDGNGRISRLLEKWFLATKLGSKAWLLESEKFYYQHHNNYYKNLRALGLEYEHLNYHNALPFLQMLPNSLAK